MVPGAEELGAKNQGREEPENKTTCAVAGFRRRGAREEEGAWYHNCIPIYDAFVVILWKCSVVAISAREWLLLHAL